MPSQIESRPCRSFDAADNAAVLLLESLGELIYKAQFKRAPRGNDDLPVFLAESVGIQPQSRNDRDCVAKCEKNPMLFDYDLHLFHFYLRNFSLKSNSGSRSKSTIPYPSVKMPMI